MSTKADADTDVAHPPDSPTISKRAQRLLDEAESWGEQLAAVWVRLLRRERKVITEKLRGSKAREGTKFWDPAPPPTETKALNVGKWIDTSRWLDELEEELTPVFERLYKSYLSRGEKLFAEKHYPGLHDQDRHGGGGGGGDRIERMKLADLLSNYFASDVWAPEHQPVLEEWRRGGMLHRRVGEQPWDKVFDAMSEERTGPYWDEFIEHVRTHGIQRPVVVSNGKVYSGHHRLWAAYKAGLETVPVVVTDDPERWRDIQAAEEEDWRDPEYLKRRDLFGKSGAELEGKATPRSRARIARERRDLAKLTARRISEAREYHEAWLTRLVAHVNDVASRDTAVMQDVLDAVEVEYTQAEQSVEAVAHSQAVASVNEVQLEIVRRSGLKGQKVWFSAMDERVRTSHRKVHGQRRDLDRPFKVPHRGSVSDRWANVDMDYPGDRTGPPGEWINCRCVLLFYPVTSSGEPDVGLEAAARWLETQRALEVDITRWLEEKHLPGQHDQSDHGRRGRSFPTATLAGLDDDLDLSEIWGEDALDSDAYAEISETIVGLQLKYGVKVKVDVRPAANTRSVASANSLGVISVNSEYVTPEGRARLTGRDDIVSKNLSEALVHEYGHVLHNRLVEEDQEAADAMTRHFLDAINYEAEGGIIRGTWNQELSRWDYPEGSFAELQRDVSFYAATNVLEATAEALVLWERGVWNKWTIPVSTGFARFINRAYEQAYQKGKGTG